MFDSYVDFKYGLVSNVCSDFEDISQFCSPLTPKLTLCSHHHWKPLISVCFSTQAELSTPQHVSKIKHFKTCFRYRKRSWKRQIKVFFFRACVLSHVWFVFYWYLYDFSFYSMFVCTHLYYMVVTGLVSIHQLAGEETQQHTLVWLRDHRCLPRLEYHLIQSAADYQLTFKSEKSFCGQIDLLIPHQTPQPSTPHPQPLWPIYADCQSRGNLQTLQKENVPRKSITKLSPQQTNIDGKRKLSRKEENPELF